MFNEILNLNGNISIKYNIDSQISDLFLEAKSHYLRVRVTEEDLWSLTEFSATTNHPQDPIIEELEELEEVLD